MKHKLIGLLSSLGILTASFVSVEARTYYVSPAGTASADGSLSHPFPSLIDAQKLVAPGDSVLFREGTYRPSTESSMGLMENKYSCAFLLDKNGEEGKPITYMAYPGEKVVFDMSEYKPMGKRVAVFYVQGDWLVFKDFDITGTQVVVFDGSNTQSECFRIAGGNHGLYENLRMHHGMAIGWFLVEGSHNLVLNCDAWCNYDSHNKDLAGADGGNVDGFGCHGRPGSVGNKFKGCRAWWNSDDGFDLIDAFEPVVIEDCVAFYNGYKPGTFDKAGDGNGFKAGGYGMRAHKPTPEVSPVHEVRNCVSYRNRASGYHANHHLGAIIWTDNISIGNRINFNMVNRKCREELVDVDGYGHVLRGNRSFGATQQETMRFDQLRSDAQGNDLSGEINPMPEIETFVNNIMKTYE